MTKGPDPAPDRDPAGHSIARAFVDHAPACLLSLLLLLVGVGIGEKARAAVAPPIYDAVEYYMKAGNVWSALHEGKPFDPFDVPPTFRPPGTILISYPFGFSPDFRGFLFRATFIPIVLFVCAFWLMAESLVVDRSNRWLNLGAAAALASLPLFYQFEYSPSVSSPAWWGLMDAFVASVSAMATALLLVSTRSRSAAAAVTGGALAAYTPLVKPVGFLLMPIILWHWVVELLITDPPRSGAWRTDRDLRRYLAITLPLIALMTGVVATACFETAYLSPANRQFASDALRFVRAAPWSDVRRVILRGIHPTVGWHGLVLFLVVSGIAVCRSLARTLSRLPTANDLRLLGASAALAGELVWWLFFPGILFRYLFPFVLIFLVVIVPHAAVAARRLRFELKVALVAAAAFPLLFEVVLLLRDDPPATLQRLAGVNLSTGGFRAEVALGDVVFDAANAQRTRLLVYSTRSTPVAGIVQAEGIHRAYRDPGATSFDLVVPLDWRLGSSIRRAQLVSSDYVLFQPAASAAAMRATLARRDVHGFDEEQAMVEAWLTGVSAGEGAEPLGGDLVKLVRVVDRAKFDEAYGELIVQHRWDDGFLAVNGGRRFYAPSDLGRLIAETRANAAPIAFGKAFLLHSADFARDRDGLQLRLTWQSLATQSLEYEVFLHLVNESGAILAQANYPQAVVGRTATEGQVWTDTVDLSAAKLAGATRIAMGLVAHPGERFLLPDAGRTDWQGRRLLLPLPGDHEAVAGSGSTSPLAPP